MVAPSVWTRHVSTSRRASGTRKKAFKDLPVSAVDPDGNPASALPPLTRSSSVKSRRSNDPAWARIVKVGAYPDTDLAYELWQHEHQYPDDLILTRVGMFYESYFGQAPTVASLLNIRLTSKPFLVANGDKQNFAFAGFPLSQKGKFFRMLLDAGRSFVVVEEEPEKNAQGAKNRFVYRRYTPGTMMNDDWQELAGGESRYLLAIAYNEQSEVGLAWIDISTDRAMTTRSTTLSELEHELARISPVEILVDRAPSASPEVQAKLDEAIKGIGAVVSPTAASVPTLPLEEQASWLATQHLRSCLIDSMPDLLPPNHVSADEVMSIDASTLLGLEIRQSIRQPLSGAGSASPLSRAGTLLSVIRRTVTPGGGRLLVNSLCQPSLHLETINARHDLVECFLHRQTLREDLRERLKTSALKTQSSEVPRILQKFLGNSKDVPANRIPSDAMPLLAGGRDLWNLRTGLETFEWVKKRLEHDLRRKSPRIRALVDDFRDTSALRRRIDDSLVEEALVTTTEEAEVAPLSRSKQETKDVESRWWIKPGFSTELQVLHEELNRLEYARSRLESDLKQRFGEVSLRTSLLGPHVHAKTEISASGFILISGGKTTKAYTYEKWSALSANIVHVGEKILATQKKAFAQLRAEVCAESEAILHNARVIDEIDLTLGFAQVAVELGLVRPVLHEGNDMHISRGRHPTVEHGLMTSSSARTFVPNDLDLDRDSFLRIITGPNMGGKSTILRQMAIISILAQAGSFVPADSARIGLVDAVFSRVGARDDLYMDRSTFMMEMHETAHILQKATSRSLVIMDEIGRGTTSTSGIAIAFATLDYLLRHIGCRTLFATHYHELADMLAGRDGVSFWCTDLDESKGRFSYAYRLKPGVNRDSHAIKVARQAGMPAAFIDMAEKTLARLSGNGQ